MTASGLAVWAAATIPAALLATAVALLTRRVDGKDNES